MYRLIFYKMEHTDIMNPETKERSWSIAIETEDKYDTKTSILELAREMSNVITIQKPPKKGCSAYIEAATLTEAHYLCMMYGYTVSGKGQGLRNSKFAEYQGLHECGTLEEDYEKILDIKRKVQSA